MTVLKYIRKNRKHRQAAAKPAACADSLSGFGPLLHAKFHPNRCNVSPLWGENLK